MKTTKKEFKIQVQNHLIDAIEQNGTTENESLSLVVSEFKNWYSPYEQKVFPNQFDAFSQFLNGLPSCIDLEYTYHGINKTLKNWFENMGETYKEQSDDKEQRLYHHLIYREFKTLCKRYNVQF